MGKIGKKILSIISLTMVVSLMTVLSINVKAEGDAEEGENTYATETLPESTVFTTMDEDGNITEVPKEDLKSSGFIGEDPYKHSTLSLMPSSNIKVQNGVVRFRTKPDSKLNTSFTEDGTNRSGYTNGFYGDDAAYLGHSADGKKVKFMLSGVIGWVNASEVEVLDYSNDKVQEFSEYYVKDGRLYHGIVTDITTPGYANTIEVGPAPSYLDTKQEYFSYDGHYFYKDTGVSGYKKMLTDYRNDTRANSVNPNNPYYNYYQFLPHRSQTVYTATELNKALTSFTQSDSKMRNLGQTVIDNQNKYGINALLILGVAANESNWGRSDIAKNNNNLFGHAAYDSDPSGSANKYSSVAYAVYYHAAVFLSKGYCSPNDWRYHGSYLGDKAGGINLKYASDPYWGEKAAAVAWKFDKELGNKDSKKYTIAIKDYYNYINDNYTFRNSAIRKDASGSSTILYNTINKNGNTKTVLSNYAVIILNNEITNKYYKIQTDGVLNSNRTALDDDSVYSFSNNYGYLYNDHLKIVHNASSSGSSNTVVAVTSIKLNKSTVSVVKGKTVTLTATISPSNATDKNVTWASSNTKIATVSKTGVVTGVSAGSAVISATSSNGKVATCTVTVTETTYKPGDVNGDGKVSSLDYIQIKNHIMKTKILTGDSLTRADVNNDGKVSSLDYIKIKNHIMGTNKLF